MKSRIEALALVAGALLGTVALAAGTDGSARHVAGTTPYQRPVAAPKITDAAPSVEARKAALRGVTEPIPASLRFLDNQGAWYTPFAYPGMPGHYDLRQWHAAVAPARK